MMDYTTAITVLSQALILRIMPTETYRMIVHTINNPPSCYQVEYLKDLQKEVEYTQFEEMMTRGRKMREDGIISFHETKSIN
jgi:hypothetical protein